MLLRTLATALIAATTIVACGDDDSGPAVTARPVGQGPALQIFLRNAYDAGLFLAGDPIDISVEAMLYDDAARAAGEFGLGLYATAPGTPPYPDGLPGYFITAHGDFFDYDGDEDRPPPDTPRRPAVSIGFVDTQGRVTYAWRFTD